MVDPPIIFDSPQILRSQDWKTWLQENGHKSFFSSTFLYSQVFKIEDLNSRTEATVSISKGIFFHFMEIEKFCIYTDSGGFNFHEMKKIPWKIETGASVLEFKSAIFFPSLTSHYSNFI